MSSRRRERPVQTGASNIASARASAKKPSSRLSASKSAPNIAAPGLPVETGFKVAGQSGLGNADSFRSEDLWGEKTEDESKPEIEAKGMREGATGGTTSNKNGYYYGGVWHPRVDHTVTKMHETQKELHDMGRKDKRYKGFFPPARNVDERRRVAATWNQKLLPTSRHWETTQQAAAKGEHDELYYFLDQMEAKKDAAEKGHDFHSFNKCRKQLADLAIQRYGSVSNMFREFDDDKDSHVTLEEFSMALKKRNLEPMFSREQQRILFSYLDKDSSDALELSEFVKFFEERDPKENVALENTDKKKVKAFTPRVQRIKDAIVMKLHQRRRNAKLLDGSEYATTQLLNAFRHIDADGSGELNKQELIKALGPSYLNLDASSDDIGLLMDAMDVNHDGQVNFSEFTKFLEVHDIDPGYNPFFDGRQRVLTKLRTLEAAPWHYSDETKATVDAFNTINDRRQLDTQMKAINETFKPVNSDSRTVRSTKDFRDTETGSFNMGTITTSNELFSDMQRTAAMQMSQICPRFVPQPPTDYTRTGLGGNGVKQKSGLYMPPSDRFTTMNDVYYSNLIYEPNKPVARENCVSDASVATIARQKRLEFRKNRIQKTIDMTNARIHLSETMSKMDSEQRLKMKATEMYGYFKGLYRRDKEIERKVNGMHKKPKFEMYDRMWNGSKQNPFHHEVKKATKLDGNTWKTVGSDIGSLIHEAEPNLSGSAYILKKTGSGVL